MSIAGKYVSSGDEGFADFMSKLGAGQQGDKGGKPGPMNLEFIVDGNKFTKISTSSTDSKMTRKSEFVIGQPWEEKIGPTNSKNVAKLEGNVLTIDTERDGAAWTRIHKFSDSGLEITHKSSKAGEAKQIFKRV